MPVTFCTAMPLPSKKSMRIVWIALEVLAIVSWVDHSPPVTTCGNTNEAAPPMVFAAWLLCAVANDTVVSGGITGFMVAVVATGVAVNVAADNGSGLDRLAR